MNFIESILFSISLCADSFAVSLCSSVTLKGISRKRLASVCCIFAIIHITFLFLGYEFGYLIVGRVEIISKIIGAVLLAYVGGSMLLEGVKGKEEIRNLNGFRNVVIGGVATSVDALAAGVSLSTLSGGLVCSGLISTLGVLFVSTFISVYAGIKGGGFLGGRMGRWAEIVGGIVLITIGVVISI